MGRIVPILVLLLPSLVHAGGTLTEVVESVEKVCRAPSESSKYWEVSGNAKLEGAVRIKLIGKVGADGNLTFTKKEWEGVQNVLQEHQADDNRTYRQCAQQLAPLFIAALDPEEERIDLTGIWRGHATSGDKIINYQWRIDHLEDRVTGEIKLSFGERSGKYRMRGKFDGQYLTFHGVEFIDKHPPFCMASGKLGLTEEGHLIGKWGPLPSEPDGCPKGTGGAVDLFKTKT